MSFHKQCLFSEVSASGGERVKLVANSLLRIWVFLALCPYQRVWDHKYLFPRSFELPLPFVVPVLGLTGQTQQHLPRVACVRASGLMGMLHLPWEAGGGM